MQMKNILVIGAGRSAVTLIKYLLDNSVADKYIGPLYIQNAIQLLSVNVS